MVLCAASSLNFIVFVTFFSMIFPNVVENPPTFTAYFSVVAFFVVIGLFVSVVVDAFDDEAVVVGINSKVLLL